MNLGPSEGCSESLLLLRLPGAAIPSESLLLLRLPGAAIPNLLMTTSFFFHYEKHYGYRDN